MKFSNSLNVLLLGSGGRVLAVTSLGGSIAEALHASYDTIGGIAYEGKNFRRDIGQDLIGLLK